MMDETYTKTGPLVGNAKAIMPTPATTNDAAGEIGLVERLRMLRRASIASGATVDSFAYRSELALHAPVLLDRFETLLRTNAETVAALRRLAMVLHEKHYAEVTQWRPLDDAIGLVTQIDNATAGLVRAENAKRMGELEDALRPFAISPTAGRASWTVEDFHRAHEALTPKKG